MEKQSYLSKSRYLLLFLFALIVGSGSAWADELIENFNSLTVSGTTLSNGWFVQGATLGTQGSSKDNWGSYQYELVSRDAEGTSTYKSLVAAYGSQSGYVVIPVELTGTISFSIAGVKYNQAGSYSIHSVTKDGNNYVVGSAIKSGSVSAKSNSSASFGSWTTISYDYSTNHSMIALMFNKAAIDNFSATIYEDTSGPGFAVKDGSTTLSSPYAYNFGLATAGTEKEFTLSNPGTEATPIAVDVTGANGFTAAVEGNATSIPAGGQKTLTITMPEATASGSIVVTPTGAGLSAFTFNVSGTLRNPNKVYLDFAGGTMPEGWTSVQTGSYSSYSWTAATGYIGTSGTSASYTHAFTSPKLVFAKDEVVMFKSARYNNKNYWDEPYTSSIVVEYSLDGSAWTAIGSAFTDDAYGAWTQRSVTIPVDGVQYIRFNGYDICLTEIYGGQLPLNPTPKDLVYSNVTNTSAQLSWTSTASNFNIQYKATGDADWTTIENVTANPYTLTGLSAVTTYQVKVQADHGVNGLSDYTDAISFITKPNPVSSFPYTENFNSLSSDEIPAYWDNSEGTTTTASYKWVYYATGHDGAGLRFNSYNNSSNNTNFLKTRPFSFTEGQPMRLSFWYKNPTGGDFSVYASTDGGATYPTELATALTGKSDWTEKVIDIPAAVFGNNVVIVFKGTSNWGNGDAYIYLDDVTINEVNDYAMSISGSDVSENTIAFGTVKNTTTTKTFTISNDGTEDLTSISVVSSDDAIFTVSETGFDIAAGGTKDITVTFIKGVEADYSETITISQANVSDKELTVTATYQAPTPATMGVTISAAAVGETVAFGTVNKSTKKTFTVANTGEATLNATIGLSGTDAANFALSTTSLVVAGGESETFDVTFDSDDEDVAKTAIVTLSAAGLSDVSFNVTGTYVNFWTEDFSAGTLPTGWVASTWTVGTFSSYENTTYMALAPSSSSAGTLMTPRLSAKAGDVLTWDGYFNWYDEAMTVEWSNNGETGWTKIYDAYKAQDEVGSTRYTHKAMSFTAPADGNYYLRFTSTYSNGVDNFSGFKLNPKTHDASITAKTIPATGNQYVEYTATVTVNELLGKDDEVVTAELWIGTTKVATEADVTLNASTTKLISLSFTPATAMSGDATIKVYNGDESINLTSDVQAVTIAAATVLDEAVDPAITDGTLASVVVKYTPADGWNTIAMPFALTDDILTDIFGAGYKIYEFKSFSENKISFATATTFYAGYPYLVYVENAPAQEDIKLQGVSVVTAKADTYGGVTFQSSYAPIAAGDLTGNYGVTSDGEIRKAGSGASLNGFRAYFTDVPASARIFIDGEATGIGRITADGELQIKNVYNLNGQKVQNVKKGLYIVNGKKVVIK